MFSSGVVARGAGDFDWRGDRARDQRSGFRCRACRTRHSRFPAKKLRVARLRNQRNLWLHCLYGCVLAFWGGNPTPERLWTSAPPSLRRRQRAAYKSTYSQSISLALLLTLQRIRSLSAKKDEASGGAAFCHSKVISCLLYCFLPL